MYLLNINLFTDLKMKTLLEDLTVRQCRTKTCAHSLGLISR